MNKRSKPQPGRPRISSGLPAPVPGEPFSIIATLRRTTRLLSVADVAAILDCSRQTVYKQIKAGRLPPVKLDFGETKIDPKAWAELLEHDNPHLLPSARAQLKIARAA